MPVSMLTFLLILSPLPGSIIFHLPWRNESVEACSTSSSRPRVRLSEQGGQEIRTVGSGPSARFTSGERCQRAQEVDLADERVRDPRLHASGPVHHERDTGSGFEVAVLSTAERTGGPVGAELLDGLVFVAIVDDGTVVTREKHECVAGETEPVEGLEEYGFKIAPDNVRSLPSSGLQGWIGATRTTYRDAFPPERRKSSVASRGRIRAYDRSPTGPVTRV